MKNEGYNITWDKIMEMRMDEFRRKYPHLAKEILDEGGKGITVTFERGLEDPWRGYVPGPIDYIRRARSLEEALAVIDYLEKRNEISSEEAKYYRERLLKEGLEAFGPRKEDGYYYKKAMEYWRKRLSSERRQQQS